MESLKKLGDVGIVPVVVLDRMEDAVPTARALLDGGVNAMEITFRTAAAPDALAAVAAACPQMLVGAGTVVSIPQAEQAVACGAKFLVSPGYSEKLVDWCMKRRIPIIPGCITPTEIMAAMSQGLRVLKFFPAGIYGGLEAMKALTAPFPDVAFVPTGGVGPDNLSRYSAAPFVYAVGGSWLCTKADIAAGRFDTITRLCREARATVLGFQLAHVGINLPDETAAEELCNELEAAFGFSGRTGSSSCFAGEAIELMKRPGLGEKGHLAIRTNSISRGIAALCEKGFTVQPGTEVTKNGRLIAVYLTKSFGGFAIHLLQK